MRDRKRSRIDPVRLGRSFDWRFRVLTARWRVLPDFVILGTQRGGTTSLFDYLARHPQVFPAFRKEVHFYDLHHLRGLGWYRAHFPLSWRMSDGDIAGEATPNYLIHPEVPSRLRATTPDAQLVVMVRDPIERAHSSWRLMSSRGIETASFEDAIAREQQAPDPLVAGYTGGPARLGSALQLMYLAKSRYAEQIERWFEVFPQEQFTFIASEDLFSDPAGVLSDLSKFLGIDPWDPDSFPALNQVAPASIDPGFRQELADYFRPHNRRLELLLGRTFDWD
jgi:hypothetical protein